MPLDEAADFTTKGARPIICQRCHESFESETDLYFMHDRKGDGPGKHVCAGCRQYYLRKTEAMQQRPAGVSGTTTSAPMINVAPVGAHQNTQKAVAAAQRQGHNHPLRVSTHVRPAIHSSNPGHASKPGSSAQSLPTPSLPWPKRSDTYYTNQSMFQGRRRPIVVPKFVSNRDIQAQYGYQEAHKLYDDMRLFFAQKASSTHQGEVVVIKVTMMTLKPAYKNPQIVSNISETISNIPLYIGVRDLKTIAYFTLLPLFVKWSKDQPLSIDDLRLRFKDWVELIAQGPGDEDVNAISNKFFMPKGKTKVLQFQRNKVLDLYLEMAYDTYSQILDHFAEMENAEIVIQDQPRKTATTLSYITRGETTAAASNSKSEIISTRITDAARSTAQSVPRKRQLSKPSMPSPPRNQPRPRTIEPHRVSAATANPSAGPSGLDRVKPGLPAFVPTTNDVRRALRAQTAPSKKIVRSILSVKSFKCTVYPTGVVDYPTLIGHSRAFDAMKDCTGPVIITLMYDRVAIPKYGAFKQALFGHLDSPAFGDSTSVVIKQCWYTSTATGGRTTYDNHSQVTKLSGEINCLRWASALMGLVYDYIDSYTETHGAVPFSIPGMRFVKSALAVAEGSNDTFLLEEVIDNAIDGDFIKYIGNGSAKLYDFLEGEALHTGKFLSFSQHLQYLKTDRLAFVSDFQGGRHLLTDPQLITSPYGHDSYAPNAELNLDYSDLGSIFSGGNLDYAHKSFTSDHTCNKFCEAFGLEAFTDADMQEDGEISEIVEIRA